MNSENFPLAEIAAHFGLGPLTQASRFESGSQSAVFLLNDHFVLRINSLPSTQSRFQNAAYALQLLKNTALPVPRLLHIDETHACFPYNLMVTEKCSGSPIIDLWPGYTPKQQRDIAHQAGVLLAYTHQQQFARFGTLTAIETGKAYDSWQAWILAYAKRHLARFSQCALANPLLITACEKVIHDKLFLCDAVTTGTLVHSDYHFENILAWRGKISAVVDFEWAMSADPAWDFAIYRHLEAQCPGSLSAFCQAYQNIRPFEADFWSRVEFYWLLLQIESVPDFIKRNKPELAQQALSNLKSLLAR